MFFEKLQSKINASGDFVIAYVIAHEVGHHVQKLLGTMDKFRNMRGKLTQKEFNRLNVKLELQADFYARICFRREGLTVQIMKSPRSLPFASH